MPIRLHRMALVVASCLLVLVSYLVMPTAAKAADTFDAVMACGMWNPATRVLDVRVTTGPYDFPNEKVVIIASVFDRVATPRDPGTLRKTLDVPNDHKNQQIQRTISFPNATVNDGQVMIDFYHGTTHGVIIAAPIVPCAGSPAIAPPGPSCTSVAFIGVRGSNETASQAGGYGKEIVPIASTFTASLPSGTNFKSVALDYTAASVSTITSGIPAAIYSRQPGAVQQALDAGFARYFSSINDGIQKLQTVLSTEQVNCPNEKIVVAGYSQGALVANQAVRSAPNVKAVLLVADPTRVSNQAGTNLGNAADGFGIYQVASRQVTRLTTSGNATVFQLCDSGDIVCDWSHHGSAQQILTGVGTHLSYDVRDLDKLRQMGVRGAQAIR